MDSANAFRCWLVWDWRDTITDEVRHGLNWEQKLMVEMSTGCALEKIEGTERTKEMPFPVFT